MQRPSVFCALALAAVAAHAAEPPAVAADAIRAHVEFLADDLLEGRAAGSRGYRLAARYVAARMREIGLEPAGGGGGYLQAVGLIEGVRDLPAATLVVRHAGGKTDSLKPLDDFIPGFGFRAADNTVTAPAVFLGHGIHAPELGHDDFAGVELEGRIAVVLTGAPARFPASQRAHYSSGRTRLEELAKRGAVGLVSVETPEEEARVPWERGKQQAWNPRMRLTDPAGLPVDDFPALRATMSVSVAAAPRLFAGGPASAEELFAAARENRSRSFAMPVELTLTTRNTLARTESENVVGMLRGSDPALAAEYLVLTAHLDHIGRGAAVAGDEVYNGALDNAAGVAVLLETARALAALPVRPRRSVLFVALTAEERGLLGAYHFVRHPTVPREALVANINTDMPMALYPVAGMVLVGAEHTTLAAPARAALAAEGFLELPDGRPEEVVFVRSDQYPFIRDGIPAIFPVVGGRSTDPAIDAEAVQRQFLKNDYHMPSDSLALPIHWPSLAKIARFNARLALAVADADRRPDWVPGDFFGATFGR